MGFLEKLQDFGFGNRGPYGRMTSGADNYASYFRYRRAQNSERGVAQSLAAAAKDGKIIPYQKAAEIAEQWGMPVGTVFQRAQVVNEGFQKEKMKKQLHSMTQSYMAWKDKNPGKAPGQNDIMKWAKDAEVTDPRVLGMAKDAYLEQTKYMTKSPNQELWSLTHGNTAKLVSPAAKGATTPLEKDKTKVAMTKEGRKVEFPMYKAEAMLKQGWQYGEPIKDTEKTSTNFERAFQEYKALPGQEKITRVEFKKMWDAKKGELTDNAALELLQNHAYQFDEKMWPKFVDQYNSLVKSGVTRLEAVKRIISKKVVTREIAQKYLDMYNNDIQKAQEAARADDYEF